MGGSDIKSSAVDILSICLSQSFFSTSTAQDAIGISNATAFGSWDLTQNYLSCFNMYFAVIIAS